MTGQFSDWNNVKAASAVAQSPLSLLILGTYLPVSRHRERAHLPGTPCLINGTIEGMINTCSQILKKSLGRPKVVQGRLEVKPLCLFPRDQEQESEHKAV